MALVNWLDVEHWGGTVHIGTTDDLGDHGRHTESCDDQ